MGRKIVWLGFGIGSISAAVFLRYWWISKRVARDVRMIASDEMGNYDIDGVSFDRKEVSVVVSGDDSRDRHFADAMRPVRA